MTSLEEHVFDEGLQCLNACEAGITPCECERQSSPEETCHPPHAAETFLSQHPSDERPTDSSRICSAPSQPNAHGLMDTISLYGRPRDEGLEITTMMVCNIPPRVDIHNMIDALNLHGYANTYDLVYIPSRSYDQGQGKGKNCGYSFVNFKEAEVAAEFAGSMRNFRFPNSFSKKRHSAKPAHFQGYAENIVQTKNSSGSRATFDADGALLDLVAVLPTRATEVWEFQVKQL